MTTVKAYWRGYEIFWVEYTDSGACDIIFYMPSYESPITGTGRHLVSMDEIELKVVEA